VSKLKIAVLFGGCSPEYCVSLQSAYAVITHLDTGKYTPVLIGISEMGEWFRFTGDAGKIKDDTWCNPGDCTRAVISPSRETRGLLEFSADGVREVRLDAAMPVLHGKYGEDGTVQGLLELAGIPVVGCGTFSSAVCLDKDRARKLAGVAGVRIPKSFVAEENDDKVLAEERAGALGYPLFVKPVRAGSSFGITKVLNKNELPGAFRLAFEYDSRAIVEECIDGIEIGCSVLGKDELVIGQLDEIELSGGFFDYKEKYTLETSSIHVPARITPQKAGEIKDTAKVVYKALDCAGFARVDMFLTKSGEIYFSEANTIPGFTLHSRLPNMLKAIGMSFEQVLDRVIELAVGA